MKCSDNEVLNLDPSLILSFSSVLLDVEDRGVYGDGDIKNKADESIARGGGEEYTNAEPEPEPEEKEEGKGKEEEGREGGG